ncbi:MAG: hypothetical protein HY602_01285 [Parcubacteria group bacterium]|nr:hypothetical protein [Parcubacteria group bacterium]
MKVKVVVAMRRGCGRCVNIFIMSNGVVVINRQQANEFLETIDSLEKSLAKLRLILQMYIPSQYGSDSWWEKSDTKAVDSIRRGQGKRYANAKEAINYLHA